MTITERCGVGLYEFFAAGFEALCHGTVMAFGGVGVVYVMACLAGCLSGPYVVWVIFWGFFFACAGFAALEAFVVLPVALVVALAAGLSVVAGYGPAPAPVRALPAPSRAHVALPVAHAHCPVCATSLAHDVVACARCETPHHRECWRYAGRCAVYGCA